MDLGSIKCAICKNYLSYFPIVIAGDAFHNLCGRCSLPSKMNVHTRNKAYENVAQFVDFPCCYAKEGCTEKLPPQHIPHHEELCFYKTIVCPTRKNTECDWQGSRSSLVEHIENEHYDMVLENMEFQIDLSETHQSENFFIYNDVVFLVNRKYDSVTSNLELSIVHTDGSPNEYSYQVCLENDNKNVSLDGQVTDFKEKNVAKILLNSFKSEKQKSPVVLAKSKLKEIQVIKEDPTVRKQINKHLLSQLICSTCSNYALPPICENDHGVITCSECRNEDVQVNNLTLDNIAKLLNYPCKYQRNGCIFVSRPEEMKLHHTVCSHMDLDCPVKEFVKCKWNGVRKEIRLHITLCHHSMISDYSRISVCVVDDPEICYIMRFFERLYRLNFSVRPPYYCWEMQMMESSEGHFKYGIEILNKNCNLRKRLILEQSGSILTKKNELFTNKDHCIVMHAHEVENFFSRKKELLFRVYIVR